MESGASTSPLETAATAAGKRNSRRRRAAAQEPAPAPTTMTEANAAIYIGMSVKWLRKSRYQTKNAARGAPPFIRCGTAIRYLRSDLDSWLEQHRVDAA